ncbi:hypothetical protein V8C86DRAFT_2923140 [Haematococcus lacustris]
MIEYRAGSPSWLTFLGLSYTGLGIAYRKTPGHVRLPFMGNHVSMDKPGKDTIASLPTVVWQCVEGLVWFLVLGGGGRARLTVVAMRPSRGSPVTNVTCPGAPQHQGHGAAERGFAAQGGTVRGSRPAP